ncbi:hypothetical protein L6R29_22295 [Myxococcota bacterium]|nr:hypothetical protein [Myxococcota bacterium]
MLTPTLLLRRCTRSLRWLHTTRFIVALTFFAVTASPPPMARLFGAAANAQPTAQPTAPLPEQPTLELPKRLRGGTCWTTLQSVREDLKRYRTLSPRLQSYQCDEEAERWSRCKHNQTQEECQKELHQKRWTACFRIRRRMRILTTRLESYRAIQKKQRCGWKLKLPKERFLRQLFAAPSPAQR